MNAARALNRARWLVARLSSMPPAELPHRLREQARRRLDRQGPALWGGGTGALPPGPPPAWPVDPRAVVRAMDATARTELEADLDGLLRTGFTLLGGVWPAERRADWAWDPETGEHWPRGVYTFGIPLGGDPAGRDPKLAWELMRLQQLQRLALGAAAGEAEAREACIRDLASWIEENPPVEGIGWACGIECATRVLSMLVVVGLLGPASLPEGLQRSVWGSLRDHGAWIARYPSLYSSANNHRVAELGALWALGCLAPQLPAAAEWRAEGADGLAREAGLQIHPDGVGTEQSPTYQAFTMEWLAIARFLAERTGHALGPVVDERLRAGATFLRAILDPAFGHPRFGDEDEGVVLRSSLAPDPYVASITALSARVIGAPELAPAGWGGDLRGLLLGQSPEEVTCTVASATFPVGGYTAMRAGVGPSQLLVVADHGPLGHAWTCGHGHADAGSLWIHLGSQPIVVDPGTYRYNGAPAWRAWMRSTAAHPTVQVDGVEQGAQTGPFNWGSRISGQPLLLRLDGDLGGGEVHIRHVGDVAAGIQIERRVRVRPGVVEVEDRVLGEGRHRVRILWPLHPDLRLTRLERGLWRIAGGLGTLGGVGIEGPGEASVVIGGPGTPGPGVISLAYNRVEVAPCLVVEAELNLPGTWRTRWTLPDHRQLTLEEDRS